MAVKLINPDGHVTHPLYQQVAIATGNTQIHLAGQVAVESLFRWMCHLERTTSETFSKGKPV